MKAQETGITGSVKNLPGGKAVKVIAEGRKAGLDKLAEYLKNGPSQARVDSLAIEWSDYSGTYSGFTIIQ